MAMSNTEIARMILDLLTDGEEADLDKLNVLVVERTEDGEITLHPGGLNDLV